MRIAFVGKGGSGKTTVCSLFAQYLGRKNLPVLVIDADINQHMGMSLGLTEEEAGRIQPLGNNSSFIKDYLRGENSRISSFKEMIKTTPPGNGSRMLTFGKQNPIFDQFERNVGKIRLMVTGPFTEEDLGVSCYHSKTGVVELLLNHLIDGPNEYVLVDMTAGADAFASGLFTAFDITLLIVEPTEKSVFVYKQYKDYAKEYGVVIKIFGNKIENDDDASFISKKVGSDLIGSLNSSLYVKRKDQGKLAGSLEIENENSLEEIKKELDKQVRNWKSRQEKIELFHLLNARKWGNSAVGKDITNQIDKTFDLEKEIKR